MAAGHLGNSSIGRPNRCIFDKNQTTKQTETKSQEELILHRTVIFYYNFPSLRIKIRTLFNCQTSINILSAVVLIIL